MRLSAVNKTMDDRVDDAMGWRRLSVGLTMDWR